MAFYETIKLIIKTEQKKPLLLFARQKQEKLKKG
jgi:hypothetical protein